MINSLSRFSGLILFLMLWVLPVNADIVDTWQFKSVENQHRAIELAKQLRCPQCQNQNLAESTSPIAKDLRLEVYRMVDEGKTNAQIVAFMTARFGDFVLYQPRFNQQTLILWLGPILLFAIASIMIWRYIYRRQRRCIALTERQKSELAALLEKKL